MCSRSVLKCLLLLFHLKESKQFTTFIQTNSLYASKQFATFSIVDVLSATLHSLQEKGHCTLQKAFAL